MFPIAPPAIRACFSWYEGLEREAARPLRRRTLPCPARAVAVIATTLLEIEAGSRPGRQLQSLCHPTLWKLLDRRLRRRGGPALTCRSLRRVVVQEHTPGVVEGVALVECGGRLHAVAMRLEAAGGRWQLTELQYVPAAGRPEPGQVAA
jgi:hypothetical protein